MELSAQQQAVKGKITMSALLWGIAAGVVIFLLAAWLLSGQGLIVRWGAAIILGGAVGYFTRRGLYNSGVAKALCPKCGTAFAITEVGRCERIIAIEQKRKIEPIQPASKIDAPRNKVSTWTEEKYEVTALDECANCHNRTERKWTATRDKDKTEVEVRA